LKRISLIEEKQNTLVPINDMEKKIKSRGMKEEANGGAKPSTTSITTEPEDNTITKSSHHENHKNNNLTKENIIASNLPLTSSSSHTSESIISKIMMEHENINKLKQELIQLQKQQSTAEEASSSSKFHQQLRLPSIEPPISSSSTATTGQTLDEVVVPQIMKQSAMEVSQRIKLQQTNHVVAGAMFWPLIVLILALFVVGLYLYGESHGRMIDFPTTRKQHQLLIEDQIIQSIEEEQEQNNKFHNNNDNQSILYQSNSHTLHDSSSSASFSVSHLNPPVQRPPPPPRSLPPIPNMAVLVGTSNSSEST